MQYGGASHDEMEVTIRLDRKDRVAHVCSAWPDWSRRLERLHGAPKRVSGRDGKVTSAFWTIPLTAIRLGRPRRGRLLTQEERQTAADRLQKARSCRGRTANPVG